MILVVGATGQLGGRIARSLLAKGRPVRALVRGGSPHDDLRNAGAELAPGDLRDPASLAEACQGVETVITTANTARRGGQDTVEAVDRNGTRSLIDAAESAGVRHFIYTSVLGAVENHPAPFLAAKGAKVSLKYTLEPNSKAAAKAYVMRDLTQLTRRLGFPTRGKLLEWLERQDFGTFTLDITSEGARRGTGFVPR